MFKFELVPDVEKVLFKIRQNICLEKMDVATDIQGVCMEKIGVATGVKGELEVKQTRLL